MGMDHDVNSTKCSVAIVYLFLGPFEHNGNRDV
jgi:hypothetical protein